MPNTSIQAQGEAMPAEKKTHLSPNLTRRRALGLLAAASVPPTAVVAVVAVAAGQRNETSQVSGFAENPALMAAYDRFLAARAEVAAAEDALEWLVDEWRHLWPLAPAEILGFPNADEYTARAERDIAGRIIKRRTADLGRKANRHLVERYPETCFQVYSPELLQEVIERWEKPRTGKTEKALARNLAEQAKVLAEYRRKHRLSEEYHAETARLWEASGVEDVKQRIKVAKKALDKACSDVSYEPARTVEGLRLKADVLQVQDDGMAPYMSTKGGALGGMARFIDATLEVIGRTSA